MIREVLDAIVGLFLGSMTSIELEVVLNKLAQQNPERLDWRNSIVDLLKLLKLDSGVVARGKLWAELGNAEYYSGTDEQNISLHKQIMKKVAERGIKVPTGLGG